MRESESRGTVAQHYLQHAIPENMILLFVMTSSVMHKIRLWGVLQVNMSYRVCINARSLLCAARLSPGKNIHPRR
jgi:hypothetical protein